MLSLKRTKVDEINTMKNMSLKKRTPKTLCIFITKTILKNLKKFQFIILW